MSLPKPEGSSNTYNDFLDAKAFGPGAEEGVITFLGAREAPKESFSDVFVDVQVGKKKYTWGLKVDSRNYSMLVDRFGTNEEKWKGKVNVTLRTKGKNTYINVVEE